MDERLSSRTGCSHLIPGWTAPAVKSMVDFGMNNDTNIVAAGKCSADGCHRGLRDVAIFFGKVKEKRCFDLGCFIEMLVNTASVVADRGVDACFCSSDEAE